MKIRRTKNSIFTRNSDLKIIAVTALFSIIGGFLISYLFFCPETKSLKQAGVPPPPAPLQEEDAASPRNSSPSKFSFSIESQASGNSVSIKELAFSETAWLVIYEDRGGE